MDKRFLLATNTGAMYTGKPGAPITMELEEAKRYDTSGKATSNAKRLAGKWWTKRYASGSKFEMPMPTFRALLVTTWIKNFGGSNV